MYFPPMFRSMINFGYQRRGLEVVAFYITFLIASIISGAIVGSIVASLFGGDQVRIAWKVDMIAASILILVVSFYIIQSKNLKEKSMLFAFLPLASAILTLWFSPIVGLIVPTILSTLPGVTKFTPPPSSSNDGANENTNNYQKN